VTSDAKAAEALIQELVSLGAQLAVTGEGKLKCSFPPGVLNDDLKLRVRRYKPSIIGLIQFRPSVTADWQAKLNLWRGKCRELNERMVLLDNPNWQPKKGSRADAIEWQSRQIEAFAKTCPTDKGYPDASDPFAEEAVTILRTALESLRAKEGNRKAIDEQ